ncbi:MAG: hypothetical protein ABFC24_11395 [Methanoregulaceae archaeon]
MTDTAHSPDPLIKVLRVLATLILAVSICLAIAIPALNAEIFLAGSNYLQLISAVLGTVTCLILWHQEGRAKQFLYAAGAFGIWAISNAAWYVGVYFGMRNLVFPSLIDMGFLAFMFLLASAFQIAFPRSRISPKISLGLLILILITPAAILLMKGITAATMMVFLYFFFAAALLVIGLAHSFLKRPLLLAGALLYCIAFTLYPLRESHIITSPYLSVIGTFVTASFCLVILGFLPGTCVKSERDKV